jgi:hypothetical protein
VTGFEDRTNRLGVGSALALDVGSVLSAIAPFFGPLPDRSPLPRWH